MPRSPRATTGPSRTIWRSSSTCRSGIPRSSPTRNDASNSPARLGDPNHSRAKHHCDIVRRFGRFPHRNAILGRVTTAEEQQYLDEGGYKG